MAEPSTVGDTAASGSAGDTLVGEDAHVVAAGNPDAGSAAQDAAPVAAGGVCVGGVVGSGRQAEVGDLALVAAIGAFVAAFVFTVGRWGLPIDREQVLAWTLGLVVAVSLATGHRFNAARALRDWSVLAVLLVAYDYSQGAQLVTAGADTFGALAAAASYSEQPGFVVIRDALRMSTASGEPPWTGLRRLADQRRLRFLDPFCSALELAGTTGAGSRQAILAQVESARSKAILEADAAAASSGEKMGAPLALIGGAFMILMGYPPLAGIMDSSTLTSL